MFFVPLREGRDEAMMRMGHNDMRRVVGCSLRVNLLLTAVFMPKGEKP